MLKTAPALVVDVLSALIVGRKIRDRLPSATELEGATAASRGTVVAALEQLRQQGFAVKDENGRGHAIVVPARVRNSQLLEQVNELAEFATALGVTFHDVTALLASRMVVSGERATDRRGQLALITETTDRFRDLDPRGQRRTLPPAAAPEGNTIREELEDLHPGG
ncbi:hypothetical protein [Leifsonia shinshuensis]|uniref:GntR family transcriptional regulator n=1 Tax=Leifsonia shinshuensis TaxID=150026 RepID=A0A7G6YA58_9MICO|nr:hypothetical protein [Leifsonia shinshuensis]QNE35373.1 hypothetical protein F1C12_09685 [Leifsonia shinshuensis]